MMEGIHAFLTKVHETLTPREMALMQAADNGDTAAITAMYDAGLDIGRSFGGAGEHYAQTPLMRAAWFGHLETVRYIVGHSDPRSILTITGHGNTALDCAIQRGHTEIRDFLESVGAKTKEELLAAKVICKVTPSVVGEDLYVTTTYVEGIRNAGVLVGAIATAVGVAFPPTVPVTVPVGAAAGVVGAIAAVIAPPPSGVPTPAVTRNPTEGTGFAHK